MYIWMMRFFYQNSVVFIAYYQTSVVFKFFTKKTQFISKINLGLKKQQSIEEIGFSIFMNLFQITKLFSKLGIYVCIYE
jgi:hypothetical protein